MYKDRDVSQFAAPNSMNFSQNNPKVFCSESMDVTALWPISPHPMFDRKVRMIVFVYMNHFVAALAWSSASEFGLPHCFWVPLWLPSCRGMGVLLVRLFIMDKSKIIGKQKKSIIWKLGNLKTKPHCSRWSHAPLRFQSVRVNPQLLPQPGSWIHSINFEKITPAAEYLTAPHHKMEVLLPSWKIVKRSGLS